MIHKIINDFSHSIWRDWLTATTRNIDFKRSSQKHKPNLHLVHPSFKINTYAILLVKNHGSQWELSESLFYQLSHSKNRKRKRERCVGVSKCRTQCKKRLSQFFWSGRQGHNQFLHVAIPNSWIDKFQQGTWWWSMLTKIIQHVNISANSRPEV